MIKFNIFTDCKDYFLEAVNTAVFYKKTLVFQLHNFALNNLPFLYSCMKLTRNI